VELNDRKSIKNCDVFEFLVVIVITRPGYRKPLDKPLMLCSIIS